MLIECKSHCPSLFQHYNHGIEKKKVLIEGFVFYEYSENIDTIWKQRLSYNANLTDIDDDLNVPLDNNGSGEGDVEDDDEEDGSIESALVKETFVLLENDSFVASRRPAGTSPQQPIVCMISMFMNVFVLLVIAATVSCSVLRQRRRMGRSRNYRQVVQKGEHTQDSEL